MRVAIWRFSLSEKTFNFIARLIFFPVVIPSEVRFWRNTADFNKIFDGEVRVTAVKIILRGLPFSSTAV